MERTLGLRRARPIAGDGAMLAKAWIGPEIERGGFAATAQDVCRGLTIYQRAWLLFWLIVGGV